MECCQAHHAGQQGPDNYADKQILGSLQPHHHLLHSLSNLEGSWSSRIPGSDGRPGNGKNSCSEAEELQQKNSEVKTGLGQVGASRQ